jgi:release factor glutamine methyltransferase
LLYASSTRELNDEQEAAFEKQIARREKREPLAYVLGEWGFRRLTLKTDRRALIPRPETEVVVERALEHIRGFDEPDGPRRRHRHRRDRARDRRRGSRCARDRHRRLTGRARLARENLDLTGINGRVRLVEHDLTSGLGETDFDLVVSNPPYVDPTSCRRCSPRCATGSRTSRSSPRVRRKLSRGGDRGPAPGGWLVLRRRLLGDRVEALLEDLGYDRSGSRRSRRP